MIYKSLRGVTTLNDIGEGRSTLRQNVLAHRLVPIKRGWAGVGWGGGCYGEGVLLRALICH